MKKIAITGSICSGKTTFSNELIKRGFPVFNCDEEIYRLYQNQKVLRDVQKFCTFVFEGSNINKETLKNELLHNKALLKKLEDILYPLLKKEARNFEALYRRKGYGIIFFEIPLLFEKKWCHLFNDIIVITSNRRRRQMSFLRGRSNNLTLFRFLNNIQWSDTKKLAVAQKQGFKVFSLQSIRMLHQEVNILLKTLL